MSVISTAAHPKNKNLLEEFFLPVERYTVNTVAAQSPAKCFTGRTQSSSGRGW